jgi:exodeoxyribonuclease VII large subunit
MSQPALDLDLDDLGDPTYSVAELADAVNQVLRRGFRDGVWVRGEIEGYQLRGGHVWFSLGEDGDRGRATLPVVLFGGTAARLRPLLVRHRLRLRDGLLVRIHGRLDLYAPTGRLSLVMDGLDPTFTLGQMAADRDQLLRTLVAEGLLDRNRRLRVPLLPLRVGLVASAGSAAWHDLVDELGRSGLPFHLLAVDVRVQGATAAAEVAGALRTLGRRGCDVIAVVRGGGARSDLAAFDTEVVARAIAASPVPVLTGLGHEIDRSVADEVAHTALKTPTACATHLVELVRAAQQEPERLWTAVSARAAQRLDAAERRLRSVSQGVERAGRSAEAGATRRLDVATARLRERAPAAVGRAERVLDVLAVRTGALDPARAMARGWSITRRLDGTLVRSPADAAPGDVLVTSVAGGTVRSRALDDEETP